MPRKTRSVEGHLVPAHACFNEAAARCRGKPQSDGTKAIRVVVASMRPRPDAAENAGRP